ncbi:sensor histidine kinase [Variovorax sp. PBL-E5]|uniref:sensor histidine kinase n=1 Tax=Variovorax sp. PBL-E5 TaxID=434014 RepID=UPI0013165D54|nr:Sensor histidine kinase LiaS [Variovorax sp. PBL-E5]
MTPSSEPDRQRSVRLAELAAHLQRAREQERAHLARELHDELGAILTAAKLDVASLGARLGSLSPDIARRLKHLADTLNSGIALKSRIVEGLCPSALANLGLVAALDILARDFGLGAGIAMTVTLEEVAFDAPTQLAIYRLVQECLTNIGKYACASEAQIVLVDCKQDAMVAVLDNGSGFDVTGADSSHHGLQGMRHRVETCGGRLTITSAPGKGTRIMAMLPKARGRAGSDALAPASSRAAGLASEGAAPGTISRRLGAGEPHARLGIS